MDPYVIIQYEKKEGSIDNYLLSHCFIDIITIYDIYK